MDTRDDLLKLENQLCFALVTAARNVVVDLPARSSSRSGSRIRSTS